MKTNFYFSNLSKFSFLLLIMCSVSTFAQAPKQKSQFWEKVQFGGGLGLGFANNSTNITIAPSAIYNFNEYASLGAGLQYSYISQKDAFNSNLYGGSIIGLLNPIEQIQISAEVEQLRVNSTVNLIGSNDKLKDNFWNTALFVGAGYRTNNVTIGGRYNVLYKDNDRVYGTAFMPFVRVYF